jgi:hypothetical protein
MARTIPSDSELNPDDQASWPAEARTLVRLRDGLSDQYTVFHGVHWSRTTAGGSAYGEIDFIIVNPWGKLLAIEQKDTQIISSEDDLFARYRPYRKADSATATAAGPDDDKSITTQVNRNLNALRTEYSRRHSGGKLSIDYLLYLPLARLKGALPSSVDPERVVDADRDDELIAVIESLLADAPGGASDQILEELPRIHDFLAQRIGAVPHIGVLGRSARELTTQLSGGLSTWASRLSMTPWRLCIRGTAGSGKTQLALQALQQARDARERALYVCFNRPLADAMKQLAPDPGAVVTFHELARLIAVDSSVTLDFTDPRTFDILAERLISVSGKLANTFQTLVIDEGQDFEPAWGNAVLAMVRPDARVLWLEDPEQSLYDREPMSLPGWVQLSSPVNYRSPQSLVTFINALVLTDEPIEAGSRVQGFDPHWLTYGDDITPVVATEDAISRLVAEGFAPANIAVLSFRGMQRSTLLAADAPKRLAGHRVRRHSDFDADGRAIWTEGELLVDTLYRFKGQAADAIVITEIDFGELGQRERRMLFVALSRARLQVALVTSERAADLMMRRLSTG